MNIEQLLNQRHFIHFPLGDGIDIVSRHQEIGLTMRHFHDTLQMTLITDGQGHFRGTRASTSVSPGSLVIIPPREAHHTTVQSTDWSFVTLHLPVSFVAQSSTTQAANQEHPQSSLAHYLNVDLNMHFQQLITGIIEHPSLPEVQARLRTFWADLQITQSRAVDDHAETVPPAIRQARNYVQEHIAETVTLQALADNVGLSVYRLAHAFREFYGLPPQAYQRQLRLQRAKTLLARGQSISNAAAAAGFADQSHFHRHFRRLTGITPGQYANHSNHVQDSKR